MRYTSPFQIAVIGKALPDDAVEAFFWPVSCVNRRRGTGLAMPRIPRIGPGRPDERAQAPKALGSSARGVFASNDVVLRFA
jgi:hypothetical protein